MLAALLAASAAAGEITPPKMIQTVETRFPAALEYTPLSTGEAELALQIDASGNLTDVLATAYTHRAFADEAIATVRQWRFEPARRDGEPIDIRVSLRINFTTKMRVATLMPLETTGALMRQAGVPEGTNLICPVRELDSPLKVIHPATPIHPGRTANLPNGRTIVDFYVDENGHARLPIVTETTHPAFGFAAVKALEDWRFAAPKRKGRPVIVRIQQEFVFENGS